MSARPPMLWRGVIPDRPTTAACADWEAPATRARSAQFLYQALAVR